MAEYDIKLNKDKMIDLLSRDDAMSDLLTSVLNQVLEAEMAEHLGADRHERTGERLGYRNGYRQRILTTRVGSLTLQVPQTRDGSFNTHLFKRYQRSEQAFVLGLMEMYLQGVYTQSQRNYRAALWGRIFKITSESIVPRIRSAIE